jgi:hypothetical protein
MVQSAYWEANSYSPSQENARILCNSKVHHRVHKSPPLLLILSQTNSVNVLESGFFNIYFNIILHIRFGLSGCHSFRSPQQNSVYIFPTPLRATWCAHHITADLIALVRTTNHGAVFSSILSIPPPHARTPSCRTFSALVFGVTRLEADRICVSWTDFQNTTNYK